MVGSAATSGRRLLHGAALLLALLFAAATSRGEDFAPGASPEESLEAWRRAVDAGAPLADLALLRPGSRILLTQRPALADTVRARVRALPATAALRFATARDRAAFAARGANKELLPVLLKREDGRWRIDLVEIEKSYAPAAAGVLPPAVNEANPYAALVPSSTRFAWTDLAEVDLLGEPLGAALERLGRGSDAESKRRLGELLLRNCWLGDEALAAFADAARLEPKRYAHARTFAWRAWAVGKPELALPLLEQWRPFSESELGKLYARAKDYERSQDHERRALQQLLLKNAPPPAPDDEPEGAPPLAPTIAH